jgi:ketosteroid isomerase-like protein
MIDRLPDDPSAAALLARIERLEAVEAIRQLAYGYALAVDARDLHALVGLYVEDVRVGGGLQGRAELRAVFDRALRQFTTSTHHVTNHLIEFLDLDDAIGLVACRIEHEVDSHWVTASLLYHDRYVRRGGEWLFRGRVQARLYATAEGDPPTGPSKIRWPGAEPAESGFYESLPPWAQFWAGTDVPWDGEGASRLVSRLKRGTGLPKPPQYLFKG